MNSKTAYALVYNGIFFNIAMKSSDLEKERNELLDIYGEGLEIVPVTIKSNYK